MMKSSSVQRIASMRPRRARLGYCQHTSPCGSKQSQHAFERCPTASGRRPAARAAKSLRCQRAILNTTGYTDSSGGSRFVSTSPLEACRRAKFEANICPNPLRSSVNVSNYGGSALHFRERLADALHRQLDLVCRSDIDQEDMVLAISYQFAQPGFQLSTAPTGETALENRKLEPVAESLHRLEDASPAALVRDIVGYNEQALLFHGGPSPRQIVRIARQLSKKKSSEQPRLHQEHSPHADLIAEHRVGRVLREPPFERLDKAPPAALCQSGSGCGHDGIIWPDFASVDGGEYNGVGNNRTKRLHDVERKRRPPITRRVIETAIGIEADRCQRDRQVPDQHRVGEGQHGIHRIGRRPAIAGIEAKRRDLAALLLLVGGRFDEAGECPEIRCR